jgi:GNAT superfamily N-acetyltransferase
LTVTIEPANLAKAQEILRLQKHAYLTEAELYDDFGIEPLMQTLDEIQAEFGTHIFLKAEAGGRLVGSVRGVMRGDTCLVQRLIVDPEFQNQGLGTKLLAGIEASFPEAERFELATGQRSERNLHLYGKLGYREFRREKISPRLTMVYLEKQAR